MNTTVTKSNFTSRLSSMVKSGQSLRDKVQELIVFAIAQYGLEKNSDGHFHGDTGYMTRLIDACNDLRTIPARTIKEYIKAHANVTYSKDTKTGKIRFVKESKKAPIEATLPTVSWYEWEGNQSNRAIADFKVASRINGVVTSIKNAQEDDKPINHENEVTALKALAETLGFDISVKRAKPAEKPAETTEQEAEPLKQTA